MMYIVFWALSLASCLLFVALAVRLVAHIPWRRYRIDLGVIAACIPLALITLANVFAAMMLYYRILPAWLSPYTLSWTIAYIAGAVLIIWRARILCKTEAGAAPPARFWPLARIFSTFGVALFAAASTLWLMDIAVRSELGAMQTNAVALMLSLAQPWVPPERNAATHYNKAFALLPHYKTLRSWFFENRVEEPAFDAASPEVATFLQQHRTSIELLHRGASMPDCYLGETCDEPWSSARNLRMYALSANLLSIEARALAKNGDWQAAFRSVGHIRNMAEHMARNPGVISIVFATGVDFTALATLEHILALHSGVLPNEWLADIQREEYFRAGAVRSWRFDEAAFIHSLATMPTHITLDGHSWVWAPCHGRLGTSLWRIFLYRPDILAYRPMKRKALDFFSKPIYEVRDEIEHFDAFHKDKWRGLISHIAMSNVDYAWVADAEARHRLASLAVAVKQYEGEHGHYPASPEELVPVFISMVPADPYDGKPLKMVAADGGIVLYSIGRDFEDNGGVFSMSGFGVIREDVTYCLGGAYQARRLQPSIESMKKFYEHPHKPPRAK